ncbi:hypothetical protein OAA27_02130 [bacterium]|nr:hypothetical protein [bacterium]
MPNALLVDFILTYDFSAYEQGMICVVINLTPITPEVCSQFVALPKREVIEGVIAARLALASRSG